MFPANLPLQHPVLLMDLDVLMRLESPLAAQSPKIQILGEHDLHSLHY